MDKVDGGGVDNLLNSISAVYVSDAFSTGTFPYKNSNDDHMYGVLVTFPIEAGIVYQQFYQYGINFLWNRLYINGDWERWIPDSKTYNYVEHLNLTNDCTLNDIIMNLPTGTKFNGWIPDGNLRNELLTQIGLSDDKYFVLDINHPINEFWEFNIKLYDESVRYYNQYTTINNKWWGKWEKFTTKSEYYTLDLYDDIYIDVFEVIKKNFSKFPLNTHIKGFISAGPIYEYQGYVINDGDYASFIIHYYHMEGIFHIIKNKDIWDLKTI